MGNIIGDISREKNTRNYSFECAGKSYTIHPFVCTRVIFARNSSSETIFRSRFLGIFLLRKISDRKFFGLFKSNSRLYARPSVSILIGSTDLSDYTTFNRTTTKKTYVKSFIFFSRKPQVNTFSAKRNSNITRDLQRPPLHIHSSTQYTLLFFLITPSTSSLAFLQFHSILISPTIFRHVSKPSQSVLSYFFGYVHVTTRDDLKKIQGVL